MVGSGIGVVVGMSRIENRDQLIDAYVFLLDQRKITNGREQVERIGELASGEIGARCDIEVELNSDVSLSLDFDKRKRVGVEIEVRSDYSVDDGKRNGKLLRNAKEVEIDRISIAVE